MIERQITTTLTNLLDTDAAVTLIGPHGVGKSRLALTLAQERPTIYLDLGSEADRAKLIELELYLERHGDKLVILDEVHRLPNLFHHLHDYFERRRRIGREPGRFLLLSPTSIGPLQQFGGLLADRFACLELQPIDGLEVPEKLINTLWARGGFPASLLAESDQSSHRWRQEFIRTYLERDIPYFAPRISIETLRRFWKMLAHQQSSLLNAAEFARALGVDGKTVAHHLDLLVDLLLVRRLEPWQSNIGKRLVKSPRIYVRDSGILHALLGLTTQEDVLGHPIAGASWEGFVIETLLAAVPFGTKVNFYRTSAGAEIDLLITPAGQRPWAIDITRSLAPKLEKGFYLACEDMDPERRLVVYSGNTVFPLSQNVHAMPLAAAAELLRDLA
ncbi:ATP-binding protein (plasmid) [Ensifer adhaerens]|uniref:ATP-binding protein n=1 Tax=Ensifer adhaerens TaxID=106592 RepID=UPI001CBCBCEF|nr:ATP-binding protein [Ensifer adhaerens]MBZ7927060.1 ATP-binding protein [Ensifer adhaerens]UAX98382.1 ATP-binding protein [Ensifer adhaerens]UAY05765.1 ATP-binding protein [Ensifer adhaerens]UAY13143.1 ATP-binding protein [Ensifer adhaerens]